MTARLARLRQEFLSWFYPRADESPGWLPFLDDVRAVDGQEVEQGELRDAVQRLLDDGLLGGIYVEEQEFPALLQPIAEGRRCVQDFEGDTVAWDEYRRRGPSASTSTTYDQRVYASGTSGQFAAHSPGARQNQTILESGLDVRRLRQAARSLLANIDDLTEEGFGDDERAELAERASDLLTEANQSTPDASRLRQLGEQLNTVLLSHPMAVGVAGGVASGTLSGSISGLLSAALGHPG